MTTASAAVGMFCLAAVVVCAVVSAVRARRRLVPAWTGALARLAELTLLVSFLLLLGQLLGTLGLFSRWMLVAGALALTAVTWALTRGAASRSPREAEPDAEPRSVSVLAATAVAALGAQCAFAVHSTLRAGILFDDSLHYHLSAAVIFVQTHSTTAIHHFFAGDATPYYPMNNELLHAEGMALLGHDTLSLLLGSVDLALVLLAVWCLGARFRVGALSICLVAPLFTTMGATIIAQASNDLFVTWPLLAAVVFALRARDDAGWQSGPLVLCGLAGGISLGGKLNLVAPVLVLLAYLVVAAGKGRRLRTSGIVLGAALLTGGYWYLRNLATVGSPLPALNLPLLPRVPTPFNDRLGFSVLRYVTDGSVVRDFFRPGLRDFFGPGWPLVVALVVLGLVWGLVHARGQRFVAVIGLSSALIYLVMPGSAAGEEGRPVLFALNLRYALVAFVLGLVLAAARWGTGRRQLPVAVLFLGLLANRLWGATSWPDNAWPRRAFALALLLAVGATFLMAVRWWSLVPRSLVGAGIAVVAVGALLAGIVVQPYYVRHRYRDASTPERALYASLQDVSDARVAFTGFALQYPFTGRGATNTVRYLGQEGRHHQFSDFADCPGWQAALVAGGFDYVVVQRIPGEAAPPAAEGWTRGYPNARERIANAAGTVFALTRTTPAEWDRAPERLSACA